MKLHELIHELSCLSATGLRDADVEVAIVTQRGQVAHRLVIGTDRGAGRTPTVVVKAVPHTMEFEVEG